MSAVEAAVEVARAHGLACDDPLNQAVANYLDSNGGGSGNQG